MTVIIKEAGEKLASFCYRYESADEINIFRLNENVSDEELMTIDIDKTQSIWLVANRQEAQLADLLGVAAIGEPDAGTKYAVESLEYVEPEYLVKVIQRFNKIPWAIGSTKRCFIRELCLSDLDELYHIYEAPGMTDYIEPLYERKKEYEYQESYIEHMYGFYEIGMWLVFERKTGRLIGRAGIEPKEYDGEPQLEIGYLIASEYQRKGYAAEVCSFIIDYAEKNTPYNRINCMVSPENAASIALAQRLGFEYRQGIETDDGMMHRYVYELHANENTCIG